MVDALASGASSLTAVKVRVLSWAPPPLSTLGFERKEQDNLVEGHRQAPDPVMARNHPANLERLLRFGAGMRTQAGINCPVEVRMLAGYPISKWPCGSKEQIRTFLARQTGSPSSGAVGWYRHILRSRSRAKTDNNAISAGRIIFPDARNPAAKIPCRRRR